MNTAKTINTSFEIPTTMTYDQRTTAVTALRVAQGLAAERAVGTVASTNGGACANGIIALAFGWTPNDNTGECGLDSDCERYLLEHGGWSQQLWGAIVSRNDTGGYSLGEVADWLEGLPVKDKDFVATEAVISGVG